MSLRFIRHLDTCGTAIEALLTDEAPVFLGRIGGSDTDLVLPYFHKREREGPAAALAWARAQVELVKHFNGFYDRADDDATLVGYCETLLGCYLRSKHAFLVGPSLLTQFLPESINPKFQVDIAARAVDQAFFVDRLAAGPPGVNLYPYAFVENVARGDTLFRRFATALEGKRVLVVSPFSRSIEATRADRAGFFRNLPYPDFTLRCLDTPITYAGLPDSFYPHAHWGETVEALKAAVAAETFDIALLACGSYAVPLGDHIAHALGRKAIYVGGVLQLYFGLMGRRYDTPFFTDQLHPTHFIRPLETARYLPYAYVEEGTALETFGAYF